MHLRDQALPTTSEGSHLQPKSLSARAKLDTTSHLSKNQVTFFKLIHLAYRTPEQLGSTIGTLAELARIFNYKD